MSVADRSPSRSQLGRSAAGAPAPSAAFLAIGLGRLLRAEVEAELAPLHLSLRHISALGHLAREPGLSYSELARRAGVTVQSMQSTLRQLEARDAVERLAPSGRGRKADLHVTPLGLELLAHGRDAFDRADDRLLADVHADRRELLSEVLLTAFTSARARILEPE